MNLQLNLLNALPKAMHVVELSLRTSGSDLHEIHDRCVSSARTSIEENNHEAHIWNGLEPYTSILNSEPRWFVGETAVGLPMCFGHVRHSPDMRRLGTSSGDDFTSTFESPIGRNSTTVHHSVTPQRQRHSVPHNCSDSSGVLTVHCVKDDSSRLVPNTAFLSPRYGKCGRGLSGTTKSLGSNFQSRHSDSVHIFS
jgi:hypothetical protein